MITVDWIEEKAKLLISGEDMVCVENSTSSDGVRTIKYLVGGDDWEYLGVTIQVNGERSYWGVR